MVDITLYHSDMYDRYQDAQYDYQSPYAAERLQEADFAGVLGMTAMLGMFRPGLAERTVGREVAASRPEVSATLARLSFLYPDLVTPRSSEAAVGPKSVLGYAEVTTA